MGQGSQRVYSCQRASVRVPSASAAARIATTSPCAVGSLVAVTELAPSPTITPSRTITAPNGPPRAVATFSVASAMARRRKAGFACGFASKVLANLISSSLSGESKVSMSQAFRSTRVLTPHGLAPATLCVEGERIAAVRAWADAPANAELTDFGDLVVLPGLVDTHVHINEPGRTDWEGFETATRAAAAGGVTTLVDMPLNCVPETTSVEALTAKRAAAAGKTWVDWAAWGGVVRGNHGSLAPLAAAGVRGFKCFLIHSGIDGFAWVSEAELRAALEQLEGTGLPLLAHAEVAPPVDEATAKLNRKAADWREYATFLASRPDEAEIEAISLLIRLAEEFRTPIHIVHLSSAKALPMLGAARMRGVPITVETCTH